MLAYLRQLLAGDGLATVFQPVLDLRSGQVYGYEALTRGPAGSPLESPLALFDAARRHGLGADFELKAARLALLRYALLDRPGKLFVNFSPAVLVDRRSDIEAVLASRADMVPKRFVIEMSEGEAVGNSARAWGELSAMRRWGFGVAIDDLGEGFASLRLWSELRPEYVKVDKHFVQGVHRDPLKLQIVRAIEQIAHVSGSSVVAEGIEDAADFQTVRDLGIRHGQGYFIGRPSAAPDDQAAAAVWRGLSGGPVLAFPQAGANGGRQLARHLARRVEPILPSTSSAAVLARFESESELQALPVVRDGRPLGIIDRHAVIDRFARLFQREIYGPRPCSLLMNDEPVIVEGDASIQQISRLVTEGDASRSMGGFIVVEEGRYLGVGSALDLMREITELQIAAARYANPLTQLPGNVPIAEHVERLIAQGCRFAACYADLDNFKPYNDVFGYQRGDEAIQRVARALVEAAEPRLDFVGHVGGDDFVLVMQSEDWEERCRRALAALEERLGALFDREDRARGCFSAEDRKGQLQLFPLMSLSIGAVVVEPGTYGSHAEVAAAATEAKRLAKRHPGNCLFVEPRRYPASSLRPAG
jgi:EAL domain-containing protein (putative c-di-GMP-specific phosphodiesterase class I)/GGDEF domain-containing protein